MTAGATPSGHSPARPCASAAPTWQGASQGPGWPAAGCPEGCWARESPGLRRLRRKSGPECWQENRPVGLDLRACSRAAHEWNLDQCSGGSNSQQPLKNAHVLLSEESVCKNSFKGIRQRSQDAQIKASREALLILVTKPSVRNSLSIESYTDQEC